MVRATARGSRRTEVEGLNPVVLRWARKRSGRTVDDLAGRLEKDAAVIRSWEKGIGAPTYAELERLAYDVLKRPVAVFFFPAPPVEPTPEESFRTLPGFELQRLLPATRHVIRRAFADQIGLRELFEGRTPSPHPLLSHVDVDLRAGETDAAEAVRRVIGVTVATQTSVWKSEREALEGWRSGLEDAGVFVFKDAIKQKTISGFCLYDEAFPLVVLNNSTSLTRQVFTLLHEVGHLLARTSGVTVGDDEHLRGLRGETRDIEVFCNRFAAEILVPTAEFKQRTAGLQPSDATVERLAHSYKVSREVVLRRFLDLGRVSKTRYEAKAKEWTADFERTSEGTGGDYYRTHASYLSPKLLGEVMRRYLRGSLDAVEAATYLGVKPAHMAGLEDVTLRKIGA